MNFKFSLLILAAAMSAAIAGCAGGQVTQSPSNTTDSTANPQATTSASSTVASSTTAPTANVSATAAPQANPSPESTSATDKPSPTGNNPTTNKGNPEAKSAVREVKSCVVKMAMVNDPESPLNVRTAPTTDGSKVIGQVQNGTYLSVEQEQAGWLQITEPMQGWVAKNRTKHGCSEKVEQVSFAKGEESIQIGDRFIGTGSHQYRFRATKGQMMTITQKEGPFPLIMAPDGKPMVPGPDDQRTQWSGLLPENGDYTVQFDSNFKGYAYATVVEIK